MVLVLLTCNRQEIFDCRIVIGSARAVASSLRNFPAILSKPFALEGFISSKSLRRINKHPYLY